ncbi:MAG TPA: hypothetical protein VGR47_21750 [Terracidiphilus sp.]|nr:hypothetical protein [Terracidiphilus sp.]
MVVAGCCWAILCSWRLARADYLFRQDTKASIRQAISMVSDDSAFYLRLAELDPTDAQMLLSTAVHLNRYNAQAEIELGLQYEAEGEFGRAEQRFLRAFAVDRTYLSRWSLASFYFRRGNEKEFWRWARKAAEMPSDSTGPLFELCWRITPDVNEITQRIVNDDPKLLRQYLDFVLSKGQASAAAEIATRIIQHGDPNTDTPRMFAAINHLIAENEGGSAEAIWSALIAKHWVVADTAWPDNPNFSREPLPVRFDWTLPSNTGVQSVPGRFGLETEFSGLEPEECTIAEQAIVLGPGNYQLDSFYRTEGIAAGTGLQWQVIAAGTGMILAESSDLSSESPTQAKMRFSIPPGISLAYLRLIYRRALGTSPISGSLVISSVQIHALS